MGRAREPAVAPGPGTDRLDGLRARNKHLSEPVCSSLSWGLYLLRGYVWGFKCEAPVCGLC